MQRWLRDPWADPRGRNHGALNDIVTRGDLEIARAVLKDPRVDPSVNNNLVLRQVNKNNGPQFLIFVVLEVPSRRPVDPSMVLYNAAWQGWTHVAICLLADLRVDLHVITAM